MTDRFRLFLQNRDIIKKTFPGESALLVPIGAIRFTDKGRVADWETLLKCRGLLKQSVSCFSNFRGTARLPILCTLATSGNPEGLLDKSIKAHTALRAHFSANSFLPLAAVILAEMTEEYRFADLSARAKGLYKQMRENHPWLTSQEDVVFAVLLATSYKSDNQLMFEAEGCYALLKPRFSSPNALQSLTHILTLSEGNSEEKCKKVLDLWEELRNRGHKYNPVYTLSSLGVVALSHPDVTTACDKLIAADTFLKEQKGYGVWGLDKGQRIIHAALLVNGTGEPLYTSATAEAIATQSALASIAAQQAAMYAVIAASAAANS